MDDNCRSVDSKRAGGNGCNYGAGEKIALEQLEVIVQYPVRGVDIVGSRAASQHDYNARGGRVKARDGEREDRKEQDRQASPDGIFGRHNRGRRGPREHGPGPGDWNVLKGAILLTKVMYCEN